jgi:hypothetical protein
MLKESGVIFNEACVVFENFMFIHYFEMCSKSFSSDHHSTKFQIGILNSTKITFAVWQQKLKKHPNPKVRKNQSNLKDLFSFLTRSRIFFFEILLFGASVNRFYKKTDHQTCLPSCHNQNTYHATWDHSTLIDIIIMLV